MPRSIAEIRKANGGLDNLTDEDILQSTFQQYKSYYPSLDAYAADVGYGGAGRGLSGSRISAGVDQYQANLLGLGGAVARGVGAEGVAGAFDRRRVANESSAAYAAQRARDLGGVEDFRDVTGVGSALNYAGGLAAQSLPYAGEAVAGALTGGLALSGTAARMGLSRAAASQLGAVAAGYPSAVGDILSAQRDAGGERLGAAALGGIPYAGLNAIGIEGQLARGLRPIVDVGGSVTRRVAAGTGMGAFGESVGEVGQEMVNQVAGRMAVNPNETLFNEEANRRYIDSAVGGATLGGLFGAAGGIRGPRQPEVERDLTAPEDTITRPSPEQFVTADQTMGLKKFVDETTGIVRPSRKGYEEQFKAAFDEPSGQFVSDPATGVERELTTGELMQRSAGVMDLTQANPAQAAAAENAAAKVATTRDPRDVFLRDELKVIPNDNSRQLFTLMEEQGVDPKSAAMVPVWNYAAAKYMTPSRLTKATELMDAAIIQSRQEAPSGTGVSTVQQPAGGLGVGSPVVQGAVGDAGPVAPIAGAVVGGTSVAGGALQQTGVLPSTAGQPPTTVTTTAPAAAPAPETRFRRAPKPMTVLEAANAAKAAQAQQAETQGQAAPAAAGPIVDPRQATLQQIFGQRNGDIIFDVVGMGMPEPEAATKYGLSRQAIQKIAGATGQKTWPERIARAKTEFGLTDAQIAEAFSIAPQEELGTEVEREVFGRGQAAGAITEAEAIEGGLENIVKTAGAGTAEVEGFTKLDKEIDATLEALAAETDEKVIAELMAKMADLTEKAKAVGKRKQAQVRRDAGKVTTEGEADAVQVESPAGVSVQPKAETGKGVGGQVRSAKKPAAEGKAQVPAKVLTEAEQAAQAWDVVAADFPEAPKFADLTKAQQENFIEFGPGNWERGDVELELTKLAREQVPFARKSRRSVRTTDQSGTEFESVEASLDDLSAYSEGIAAGVRSLRESGMGNAVDAIDSWMVTFSPVSWDAIYTMIDGKRTIIYNGVILKDKILATTATLHEVGHGIDEVQGGAGKFSGGSEFRMSRVNGELLSMRPGTVADELLNHWEDNSETSALGGMLNYPLDMTDPENRSLTMQELREEVFAQVWAFSNMNGGMDYLRDNLPITHAFMEKAHEQVKATNYQRTQGAQQGAQSGQVQAGQQNAQLAGAISRASRQRQGLIDRNIAKLPKQAQQPVKRVTEAIGDLGGAGLDYVVFTSDLVKRAQALGLGAAKTFSDRLAARNAKVSEEERKIEKIADGYASIEDENKGSGPDSVNDFLFESTRTGKWGYGKYRDAKMGAAFDKLKPKAQQFVKDVFAHGDATLSNKKKIVLEATNSEYDAMIKAAQDLVNTTTGGKARKDALDDLAKVKAEKAATLKRFQTLFRVREGMPYAPIKRTGNYVVIGKSAEYIAAESRGDTAAIKKLESDPDHYHVSFVDTKWQARNLKDNLAEQGVFPDPQFAKRAESFDKMFSGEAALPAVTKLRNAVDAKATTPSGAKDPTAGKMLNIISQLYLEALAEGSARKSEMRRRGVAGEVDMLQSFTQQGRADANFLASVEFEPKIQESLQQMRNQSRTGDRDRKSEIFDELTKRYAGTLDPQPSPFINGLTNMASKFFLASSPAYYLQNLTQPFMMSLPAMAGRHNYTKAAAELAKAYGELGPLFKDVKLFDEQFDFSKVPADVRAAINDLVNQGKIDIGLATEINEYKVEADNKLSKFAQRLNKGMRMAVQKVEATNRLSTAIAAYRLEFERAKKDPKIADPRAAATQYAADILTDTHGDYTAFNAPRAFNTQWGKVALQFRKFQLIQIAFYAKLIRDAFTKPDERAAAMKTLAYSLGHTGVFAGLMGLPGYAAISAILGAFGDEDEPYDLTAEMRKALGPEWADMIMRGAPTIVGMDLSGKIGAGNMLSIMPFSDADLSTTAGQAEALGTLLGGAVLGMTSRVADGLILMSKGDYYKGLERVMPKGVSDALKAGRQATEGMTRRNGDVVLPESEIGAIETVLTGLGVPSVQQTVTYERQNRMRDITQNFQDRTTRIKNDYAQAVRQKDTAAMQDAREAWTKLQQARQRNGLKPQPVSNLLKAPQEQAQREKRTVGGVQYREGQRKLAEDVTAN